MKRMKIVGLALLCLVVLGAMGPVAAHAAACNANKKAWVFCSGGNELAAEQRVTGTPTINIVGELQGKPANTSCTGFFEGKLAPKGELKGAMMEFDNSGCSGTYLPPCKVKYKFKIKADGKIQKKVVGATEPHLELKMAGKLDLEGCAQAGKYEFKGDEVVTEPSWAQELETHTFKINGGTKLTFEGKAATVGLALPMSLSGGIWSMGEGL